MKKFSKYIICLILIILSIFVLNLHEDENNKLLVQGNELSYKSFSNDYVTKLNNEMKSYDMEIPERFTLVSENETRALYFERDTLALAILNKRNGYVWYSYDISRNYEEEIQNNIISKEMANQMRSGVLLRTYNVFTPGLRTLFDTDLLGKSVIDIKIDTLVNGFLAHIDFTNVKIKFDLQVYLEGNDLVVEIPYDSIVEYDPKLFEAGNKDVLINEILIYPFLGAIEKADNGYIVIPDGSGAIVSLNEVPKYRLNYSAPVYGKDLGFTETTEVTSLNVTMIKPLARITLPIYGIIHEVDNTGLLVISESGANYATYNYVSRDVTTPYYQSYFTYSYRTAYKQFQSRVDKNQHILGFQRVPNIFDLKQRYVLLDGNEANYVGLAKTYRDYLVKNNELKDRIQEPQYRTKFDIIGNEIEQGILWNKNVPTTQYEDVVKIIKEVQTLGLTKLDVTYKAFAKGKMSYRFDVMGRLGGNNDFKDMLDFFDKEDIDFSYYVDYIRTYKQSKHTAMRLNRKAMQELNYSYMFAYYYINNTIELPELIEKDLKKYHKYDITELALDGFKDALYTHTDKKRNVHFSVENQTAIYEALQILQDNNIRTSIYNPDAYLYRYVNKYLDAPLSSSELLFVTATIPLVELIVSGYLPLYAPYLNFTSSETDTLLRLVEYGVNPCYVLSGENTYKLKYTNSSNIYVSNIASLKERIKTYDEFLQPALSSISGYELVNHYFYQSGVTVSTFSNGITVIVNYNDYDVQYNGLNIPARGYQVQ